MAYSSSFSDPPLENSATNDALSTASGDRLLVTQRSRSPLPDDDSNASINARTAEYSAGKYHAVDQIVEEPRHSWGEGFSFGLSRLRRRLPGTSTQRPQKSSVLAGQLAVGKAGWWTKHMLVDRSLRLMAALMTVFAFSLIVIVIGYANRFNRRLNRKSTSIGVSSAKNCDTVELKNRIIHLIINISATMVLGMSNTYQQLVTALNVDEIRWVLSKKGDSRVGTNSPFAINDKSTGKLKHWLAWLLLITTSLPVHLLANSLVGPSLFVEPPGTSIFTVSDAATAPGATGTMETATPILTGPFPATNAPIEPNGCESDLPCWVTFRSGQRYHFPKDTDEMSLTIAFSETVTYSALNITYTSNCTQYMKKVSPSTAVAEFEAGSSNESIGIGKCQLGYDLFCDLSNPKGPNCRLNIRYQAALVLAGCLTIKAMYMISVNLRARKKVKGNCLTFGDVIVASTLDPILQVRNECLVNVGDGYRHQVTHKCHNHCKDPVSSATGDEIGHCQKAKCKKFNIVDRAANLVHPVLAIKYKKSLISNLGTTAVSQMIILMLTSLSMFGFSMIFAVGMGQAVTFWNQECIRWKQHSQQMCHISREMYLNEQYGSWGGFNSSIVLLPLPVDRLVSEQVAFWASNGAQLVYSLLYLLLIYNITLISMEYDWGKFEMCRQRLRCTIVRGDVFEQSYMLQLPKKVMFPIMGLTALMHWLLGQSISAQEIVWHDDVAQTEHSQYQVVAAPYPVFLSTALMIGMTTLCWWAFTFKREGFMPQMYGSIRACCSATTELDDFTQDGVQWGDLGHGEKYRHAGFSSRDVGKIVPGEPYCGGKESE